MGGENDREGWYWRGVIGRVEGGEEERRAKRSTGAIKFAKIPLTFGFT